jgi:hypothetical protein
MRGRSTVPRQQRGLPGRSDDLERHTVGTAGEQELAATRGLEPSALRVAQLECPLDLRSLTRTQ